MDGNFVVCRREGCGISVDMSLGKQFKKPAKSQSGIVGFTRSIDAVSKQNLIKHNKAQFTEFINSSFCDILTK